MKTPLTGILPVAPTPVHADGRVDEEGMRRVLDCMIDQGVDAICIRANYSEQFLLADEERALMMKVSLEHVAGRVPVIVTISHFATEVVVARAKAADAMGAAMVMMMPPYHGVGLVPAEAGIFEQFAAVSDADTAVRGLANSLYPGGITNGRPGGTMGSCDGVTVASPRPAWVHYTSATGTSCGGGFGSGVTVQFL